MGPSDRDFEMRRRRGLAFGGVGILLLFIPAVFLVLSPGSSSIYAIVAMLTGVVFLIAGFVALPGNLRNLLRPKP